MGGLGSHQPGAAEHEREVVLLYGGDCGFFLRFVFFRYRFFSALGMVFFDQTGLLEE